MALPPPEPGTVIRYAYLWADEHRQGREEGRKDRPCVVVVAVRRVSDATMVTVVPVTRAPQGLDAVEIPAPTCGRSRARAAGPTAGCPPRCWRTSPAR